ncbi:hypothetical protein SAY86_000686 [Trapa natans]|uniref:Pentatricopeptide repeat-containing protein n=1 Tax=Trapa natans TaxID=22666 RepID=A0AAN7M4E3_TRANT|nr:hypothetical protein SAY86_000686 [Trapa natans]
MVLIEYTEYVFDEMVKRGVCLDGTNYKLMIIAYCWTDHVLQAGNWLATMIEKDLVDNATCSLIIRAFSGKGLVHLVVWYSEKMVQMGLNPNVIIFTCLINGICQKGNIIHAIEGWRMPPSMNMVLEFGRLLF